MADNDKTDEQKAAEERAERARQARERDSKADTAEATRGQNAGAFPTAGTPAASAGMAGPKEGPRSLDRQADLNPDRQRVHRDKPTFGERMDRERSRGAEVAAANAAKFDEAERMRREGDEREVEDEKDARTELEKKFEESAAAVDKKMADLPPPGPGMAKPDPEAVRKTMDPNNPLVNPRASDEERLKRQPLPPGAFSPAPVLPQDTVQTQEASKPPTPAHAEEGEKNRGAAETPPKNYGEPDSPNKASR